MNAKNLGVCVVLLLLFASPRRAESSDIPGDVAVTSSSISASASASCGIISFTGSITLDSGSKISLVGPTVTIFKNGCEVSNWAAAFCGNSFSGNTDPTKFAAGTYTVVFDIEITDACCTTETYTYKTTVTVN